MALVDYASSDDSDADDHDTAQPPPAKKQRLNSTDTRSPSASISRDNRTPKPATLPPLPAAFHNLYATTVRPSTADQPALHQNRRRVIPHVEGNWPSHIFVEWHPSSAEHAALTALVDALTRELAEKAELTTFLASDLHAPLPLHVSLSRPFVLRTEQKEGFLSELLGRCVGGVAPFELCADGLTWFRNKEAGRSFLVLKVRSCPAQAEKGPCGWKNPELAALLGRCNELVGAYGQPRLYACSGEDGGGVQPVGDEKDGGGGVDDAFHVSIAWSFAEPTPELREKTAAVFAQPKFLKSIMDGIRISVNDIKVKIGNVVTNIPLAKRGRKGVDGGQGLFGI